MPQAKFPRRTFSSCRVNTAQTRKVNRDQIRLCSKKVTKFSSWMTQLAKATARRPFALPGCRISRLKGCQDSLYQEERRDSESFEVPLFDYGAALALLHTPPPLHKPHPRHTQVHSQGRRLLRPTRPLLRIRTQVCPNRLIQGSVSIVADLRNSTLIWESYFAPWSAWSSPNRSSESLLDRLARGEADVLPIGITLTPMRMAGVPGLRHTPVLVRFSPYAVFRCPQPSPSFQATRQLDRKPPPTFVVMDLATLLPMQLRLSTLLLAVAWPFLAAARSRLASPSVPPIHLLSNWQSGVICQRPLLLPFALQLVVDSMAMHMTQLFVAPPRKRVSRPSGEEQASQAELL